MTDPLRVLLFDLDIFFIFCSAVLFFLALIAWARVGWQVRGNPRLRWSAVAWMFALDNGIMTGLTAYQAYRTYLTIKSWQDGLPPETTLEQLAIAAILWLGVFSVSVIHLGFALGFFKTSRPGLPGARGENGESHDIPI